MLTLNLELVFVYMCFPKYICSESYVRTLIATFLKKLITKKKYLKNFKLRLIHSNRQKILQLDFSMRSCRCIFFCIF